MQDLHSLGPKVCDKKVSELMSSTYYSQRVSINKRLFINDLVQEWPYLFMKNGLINHFDELVSMDIKKKLTQVKNEKITAICRCLMSSPVGASKCLQNSIIELKVAQEEESGFSLAAAMILIMGYFGEPMEILFPLTSVSVYIFYIITDEFFNILLFFLLFYFITCVCIYISGSTKFDFILNVLITNIDLKNNTQIRGGTKK